MLGLLQALTCASCDTQDATRKSLITATAASSMLGCIIMGARVLVITLRRHYLSEQDRLSPIERDVAKGTG